MDMMSYTRYFLSFIFVIGLMYGLSWLARRFMPGAIPLTESNRQKRLGLVEVMAIDAKRRLVLVKRDNAEHLLLLGQNSETVVETNITSPLDGKRPLKNNKKKSKA